MKGEVKGEVEVERGGGRRCERGGEMKGGVERGGGRRGERGDERRRGKGR